MPIGMNVFASDAFSMVSMTAAVNRNPYLPTFLGQLGLFEAERITTTDVAIEMVNGRLTLIPTTERGAPLVEGTPETSSLRIVRAPRLAKGRTLYAHQMQNLRAYTDALVTESGIQQITVTELQQATAYIYQAQSQLNRDMQLTWEHHRLGAVQGNVLDSDGSTSLFNWFTLFGVSQPAEVDWDLDNAAPAEGAVRKLCNATIRAVQNALQGMWIDGRSYLLALAGDNFYDQLTQHKEVRETYLNTAQAADLRDNAQPYSQFRYGGITWSNYRGTGNVAVNTNKAIFIPVNVPGLFKAVYTPGEFWPYVNTMAKDMYSLLLTDEKRLAWVRPEVYSYPLHYCTVPESLLRGRRT